MCPKATSMSGQLQDPVVLDDDSSSGNTNDATEDVDKPGTSGTQNQQLVVKKVDRLEDDEDEGEHNLPDDQETRMSHDSDNDSAASGEYIVEAIRSKRKNPKSGSTEYYIKWKDWPESANTWEPTENLKCPKLMQEFNDREKNKRRRLKTTSKQNDLTPQPAKRLRRGPPSTGNEDPIHGDDEKLFLEDDDDDDDDEEDDDDTEEIPRHKNRKNKQKEAKETRAEPVGLKGFERGLPLDKILNACHGDDDKLYFFVTWAGRDELELVESDELEQKAPRELCKWYRKRLYWQNNSNETNGTA